MRLDTSNGDPYNYTVITISSDIEKWDETVPEGDNWNLETIHAQSAWNKISNPYKVKVGVLDSYFEENRKDNDIIFDYIKNPNPEKVDNLTKLKHGTHVAGIIGATNDGSGMVGISPGVQLYGYSYLNSSDYTDMMYYKLAFANLIINQVRIINVSLAYPEGKVIAASCDNLKECEKARQRIKDESELMAEFLDKLVQEGYDFLIVNAAGNNNCKSYIKDTKVNYNYRECKDGETADFVAKDIDSKYAFFINAIEDNTLKNRIIVVGSMNYSRAYSSFSNVGSRVNVCAPGETILSVVPYSVT